MRALFPAGCAPGAATWARPSSAVRQTTVRTGVDYGGIRCRLPTDAVRGQYNATVNVEPLLMAVGAASSRLAPVSPVATTVRT